ncbi:hypothetical protein H6H03_07745 [Nostoc paludosum FACHB-159]|uniref:Uncharacterized protein n=2 Tax=Nostoc TaxID=1177 RepID=A0ABR8K2Z1_9NOSO|nr:hypothetical protein [Nostoc paludosum FACHB-159]
MKINLGMTKFMIFCIGAYILIPKIVGYVGVFSTASASSLNSNGMNTLIARKVNSPDLKDTYIPPNYGGPDSQHGSGTR